MGTLNLVCPMCCGETFDNSQSLKYHLLSMTDNLYCPNCAERSDSVSALIQHLDCCGEATGHQKSKSDSRIEESKEDRSPHKFLATVNDDGVVVVDDPRTIEMDEHGDIKVVSRPRVEASASKICSSIVADPDENVATESLTNDTSMLSMLKDGNEILEADDDVDDSQFMEIEQLDEDAEILQVKQEQASEEEDAEALYSCSSCGMSFNSVLEHIKEYHDGQEVVLEMAEQQLEEMQDDENNPEMTDDDATPLSKRIAKVASEANSASSKQPSSRQRQTMNTLRTEECVDSEGRLYTRKVVQIERFWDRSAVAASPLQLQQHQSSMKSAPMIEKFFSNVEGVKIRGKSPASENTAAASRTSFTSSGAPQRMYRCNKCLEQFMKLGEFRVHACVHGNNRCDLCDQAFASIKALQLHSRIHEGETVDADGVNRQNFTCPICTTEFTSHKSLRLHSRMHAPVRARHVDAPEGTANEEFTCLECGKTLSESYRKAHMALHKGDSVTCTVCNRKFDSADSLEMHAAVHLESGSLQQQQQQLQMQEELSGPVGGTSPNSGQTKVETSATDIAVLDAQKPYQCQHCGRRFTRPHEKVKHERIHTGEKPHACEVCGKTFRVSYCLTLHMRTHTGVRPYACQHCGKRFKASSVYNHHLLTHGEERAYTCPYCPKTFKTRVQLAGHKNSHTKPFRCTVCSRPFASLYAARAHIQTHKKDNNLKFSCYICGASYGRAFALKDHLKVHGGQQDILATPEPTREEEVAEVEEYLLPDDIDDLDEIDDIDNVEKKLVEAANSSCVTLHQHTE